MDEDFPKRRSLEYLRLKVKGVQKPDYSKKVNYERDGRDKFIRLSEILDRQEE